MTMTSMEPVTQVEHRDGIATITLCRTAALNAFNAELAMDFSAQLKHLGRDAETRVIVVTGSGRAFSAGQDVYELAGDEESRGPKAAGDQLRDRFLPIILLIRSIEKPVIAQVNGIATGAGLGIAMACDFRVAADTASFIMSPFALGLIPGAGLTALAPGLVGIGAATELFMLGKRIDANEARELGLVHRVVEPDRLADATHELALQLAAQPRTALGLTKRALNRSCYSGLEEQMRYEAYLQEMAAGAEEHLKRLASMTRKEESQQT
ncbi:2-(1,2-epoxy-1,2-dihydrophenyl)acetyl-CoA isomerase PaaG [soil metagenome]